MSRPMHVFIFAILAGAVLFGAGCGAEEAVAVDLKIPEDGPNVGTFGSGDELIKRVVAEMGIPVA